MPETDRTANVIRVAVTAEKHASDSKNGLVDCVIFALGGLALTLMLMHQGILPVAMQLQPLQ